MLDIKFIRDNPDILKKALKNRGAEFDVDVLLDIDEKRRAKIKEADDLRARQKKFAEAVATLQGGEREEKIAESRDIKSKLAHAESDLKFLEEKFESLMYQLPNIPDSDVPVGEDERSNKILREVGERPKFNFKPRDYMEIAARLDLIDTERAAKVSGPRFGYLKNEAVLLEMALVRYAFDKLAEEGFLPVIPPVLIKEEMMKGVGYIDFEKDREERYFLEKDKLYLVGTAEQSIGPMHADEVFEERDLPRRYVAFSSCFRREAGSYGKDTHGVLRVHQFDKVEMVSLVKPEDSKKEHEFLLAAAEKLMQELEIPYRIVALCTGDISQPSAATFDLESWLPGQNKGEGQYRETHSISNTTDFQARRLNIKYRKRGTEFIHILNGTACAIGRTLIAILENYQQEDGSVRIPSVLQKYMQGLERIKR
jgi:seryl-tRNA synthetase